MAKKKKGEFEYTPTGKETFLEPVQEKKAKAEETKIANERIKDIYGTENPSQADILRAMDAARTNEHTGQFAHIADKISSTTPVQTIEQKTVSTTPEQKTVIEEDGKLVEKAISPQQETINRILGAPQDPMDKVVNTAGIAIGATGVAAAALLAAPAAALTTGFSKFLATGLTAGGIITLGGKALGLANELSTAAGQVATGTVKTSTGIIKAVQEGSMSVEEAQAQFDYLDGLNNEAERAAHMADQWDWKNAVGLGDKSEILVINAKNDLERKRAILDRISLMNDAQQIALYEQLTTGEAGGTNEQETEQQ